jgi:hypothetical protein
MFPHEVFVTLSVGSILSTLLVRFARYRQMQWMLEAWSASSLYCQPGSTQLDVPGTIFPGFGVLPCRSE